MAINSQTFGQLVTNAAAAVQGAANALVDFAQGSINLALIRAVSGIALWLQGLILQVAAITRLSSSTGSNVDTFVNDFGDSRLLAVSATAGVTFARFTPTAQASITAATSSGTGPNGQPLWAGGQIVQTQDGTQQFMVIPDTTKTAYNATTNTYVVGASVSSADATAFAVTPGSAGNVAEGTITVLGSSIVGIDTVTNASAADGGKDNESDAEVKTGFPLYIKSLSKGTPAAVVEAVESLQEGATCVLVEDYTYSGVYQAGYFYCICDDGTGSPSGTFLSNCYNAIDAARAINTTFNVFAPSLLTANVSMVITVASGYILSTVEALVISAITAFINALADDAELPYSRLQTIAYGASPGVTNVTSVLLNGGTADLVPTAQQEIRAGTISVT